MTIFILFKKPIFYFFVSSNVFRLNFVCPVHNFTNILGAAFDQHSLAKKLHSQTLRREKLCMTLLSEKAACKWLVKLTYYGTIFFAYRIGSCGQFHQRFSRAFFVRIFCQSQNVTRKSCGNNIRTNNSYVKTLMKLTPGNFLSQNCAPISLDRANFVFFLI